jgi:predicted RNase H-like HicB family nuclease
MTKKLHLSANVWREDEMFIARRLEFDVASQGYTVEEALDNLREAVELFLEPPTATVKL